MFASAGKGLEAPTFSELAYRPDGLPGLNFDLDAADSTNMELGVKWRLGDHAQLNTTLFRSNTSDDIVTGPAPFPGRNTFVNADKTRREGVEFAASMSMLDAALTHDLAYTYTRARFKEFVNFAGVDLSGNQIPGVPENAAYLQLNWRHAPSGFSTGVEARWADQVFADDLNSASRGFVCSRQLACRFPPGHDFLATRRVRSCRQHRRRKLRGLGDREMR